MEPAEMIKYLEEQNDFSKTPLLEDSEETETINEEIIGILKKQIPLEPAKSKAMEPIKIGHLTFGAGVGVEYCPVCNRLLTFFPTYCPDCGQKIKR